MDHTARWYTVFTSSPYWKSVKKRIFAKRGRLCEECFDVETGLIIHHKTYKRFGEELDSDLLILCSKCHDEIHANTEIPGMDVLMNTLPPPKIYEHIYIQALRHDAEIINL